MINLYPHQQQALARLKFHDQYMLAMDQGTGKTLPTLWHIRDLVTWGKAKYCLIVCPKAVVGSWERDIKKFDRNDMLTLEGACTITTYDKVWRDPQFDTDWDIIVLDEAHKIKNRNSKRGKFLLNLALKSKYRYLLTGTPISNGQLENVWSLMAFLHPVKGARSVSCKDFGSYYDWCQRYAYLNQWHQPYSYKHVEELQAILKANSYRVLKSECLDLPDKLPDEIYDIELLEKKRYKEMMKESTIEDLELIASNGLSRMTKLRTLCSGFVNTESGELVEMKCEKMDALVDFLEDMGEGKLVIFCEYRHSIEQVDKLLAELRVKHLVLSGDTKDKTCWTKFQTDESIKVIVCQYQTANAGIDLYAADTMLFYEPTLSSNVLEQAKDRIHRIGQHRPCRYVHFLTKGTIEHSIYNSLKNYADFSIKLFQQYITDYAKGVKV